MLAIIENLNGIGKKKKVLLMHSYSTKTFVLKDFVWWIIGKKKSLDSLRLEMAEILQLHSFSHEINKRIVKMMPLNFQHSSYQDPFHQQGWKSYVCTMHAPAN